MRTCALVSWCLLWLWAPVRPTQPAQRQGSGETAEQAAQITLLVLRATVKGGSSPKGYLFLPSGIPLSRDRAVSVLTAMRKPIECGVISEGPILAIACHPLNEPETADWRARARQSTSVFEEEGRENRCPEPILEARLLVHRRGDSLQVPLGALAVWFRDYKVASALGVEDGVAPPRGVCMVIGVDPAPVIRVKEEGPPIRSRT